jgi:hypothetical protein
MKNLITCSLFLLAVISGKAQKIDSASVAKLNPTQREEVNLYLQQAKKAKNTAMILSIGGGAVAAVGGIIYSVALEEELNSMFESSDDYSSQEKTGAAIFYTGAACALASIPFFIKVHKNREAARAIIYSSKGMTSATGVIMPGTQSTNIGLVVSLGRKH